MMLIYMIQVIYYNQIVIHKQSIKNIILKLSNLKLYKINLLNILNENLIQLYHLKYINIQLLHPYN